MSISNLPEDDFIQHEDLPYCIGEFVWTGFDYLGEPTPYYTDWPAVDKQLGRRVVRVDKYRDYFAFVSFPVPVREDVESFHVLVPVTAVEVIAVFGQSGKVDDTE